MAPNEHQQTGPAAVALRLQALQACGLFTDAPRASLNDLARRGRLERIKKGELLFAAGDEPDGLRIVHSGSVRIWLNDADGHELTLGFMGPGQAFGEIALFDGLPRTAHASAAADTELVFLSRGVFEHALAHDAAFARAVIRLLCRMVRRKTDDLGGFAFQDLGIRLARKIYQLVPSHAQVDGPAAHFGRDLSQTELARLLGVSREAINKRLQALSRQGLVALDQGRLVVPDVKALAAFAQAGGPVEREDAAAFLAARAD
ncbi:MAG: Crp/Fnr family transcriptional regulator [Pseudomonadota bacterium]